MSDPDDEGEVRLKLVDSSQQYMPVATLRMASKEAYEVEQMLYDDHHTLAGFLLERLQHIPSPGEAVRFNGLQFEITTMAGPRIERVRLVLPDASEEEG